MGYHDPAQVETELADQSLTWWLVHLPTNAWVTFAIASLLAGVLLSWVWHAIGRWRMPAAGPDRANVPLAPGGTPTGRADPGAPGYGAVANQPGQGGTPVEGQP